MPAQRSALRRAEIASTGGRARIPRMHLQRRTPTGQPRPPWPAIQTPPERRFRYLGGRLYSRLRELAEEQTEPPNPGGHWSPYLVIGGTIGSEPSSSCARAASNKRVSESY